jgi:hypothetical protein
MMMAVEEEVVVMEVAMMVVVNEVMMKIMMVEIVVVEIPMMVNEAMMKIMMAEIAVAENMAAGTVPIRVSAEVPAAKMAAIHVTTSEVSASDVTTAPMSTAVTAAPMSTAVPAAPCPPPCPPPCASRPPPKKGPRKKAAQNTTARSALFRAPANLLTASIFMSLHDGTANRPAHASLNLNEKLRPIPQHPTRPANEFAREL